MKDIFEWLPDVNQEYNNTFGSQTLVGPASAFSKSAGTFFTMAAHEETLLIKPDPATAPHIGIIDWPNQETNGGMTTFNIEFGRFEIDYPEGVLWIGGRDSRRETEINIRSVFSVKCRELIFFGDLNDAIRPVTTLNVVNDGIFDVAGGSVSFNGDINLNDNGAILTKTDSLAFTSPSINLFGNSKILMDIDSDIIDVDATGTTAFILHDSSYLKITATAISEDTTSKLGILVMTKGNSSAEVYIDEYRGPMTYVLEEGSSTITVSSRNNPANPFLYSPGTGERKPKASFNFVTADGLNNGTIVLKGLENNVFQRTWLAENKIILIDNVFADEADFNFEQRGSDLYISLARK